MRRLLFVLFSVCLSVFTYSCRLPGSVATYSINVDGKNLGEMTQTLSAGSGAYLAKESGFVKFLFMKDSYSLNVDGDFFSSKGFLPIELVFKDEKTDRHISRDVEPGEFDSLSYQLQLRYNFILPKSPVPRQVWVDRNLLKVTYRVRPAQLLYVSSFKKDLRVVPVKFKMSDGTSGTLWFAKKINYLVVKRKQINPSSVLEGKINRGSTVINELVSYKTNGDCLAK
jgi:hypothetical protein